MTSSIKGYQSTKASKSKIEIEKVDHFCCRNLIFKKVFFYKFHFFHLDFSMFRALMWSKISPKQNPFMECGTVGRLVRSWSSFAEGDEGSFLPHSQSNLVIVHHELSLFIWYFIKPYSVSLQLIQAFISFC